jgi:hypothetical protein
VHFSTVITTSLVQNLNEKITVVDSSVAEPHHFYAAPAPGENFDSAPAAPALAPASALAPTLLYRVGC